MDSRWRKSCNCTEKKNNQVSCRISYVIRKMKLSVIVPVYNAGPYLKPCVQSICTLPIEKELILVNDGSTDGAFEALINESGLLSAKADGLSFKILSQENQGVSAARNRGLQEATGEWIWFVDSDDVVYAGSSTMMDAHEDTSILLLPFEWEEDGKIEEYVPHDGEIPYNLWRCWFRREEIERQGMRFTSGRKYAEDQEFILRFLLKQGKHQSSNQGSAVEGGKAWSDGPVYHYVMRSSGAMKKKGTKGKQLRDISRVWWNVFSLSVCRGVICRKWVLKELKRMAKTWYVTACR